MREKSKAVLELLNNRDKLEDAREQAKRNREKFFGGRHVPSTIPSTQASYALRAVLRGCVLAGVPVLAVTHTAARANMVASAVQILDDMIPMIVVATTTMIATATVTAMTEVRPSAHDIMTKMLSRSCLLLLCR